MIGTERVRELMAAVCVALPHLEPPPVIAQMLERPMRLASAMSADANWVPAALARSSVFTSPPRL